MSYTTKQAAEKLGVTVGRVRQLAGALGLGEKWGRDWMFSDADLERMQQRQTHPGPAPSKPKVETDDD